MYDTDGKIRHNLAKGHLMSERSKGVQVGGGQKSQDFSSITIWPRVERTLQYLGRRKLREGGEIILNLLGPCVNEGRTIEGAFGHFISRSLFQKKKNPGNSELGTNRQTMVVTESLTAGELFSVGVEEVWGYLKGGGGGGVGCFLNWKMLCKKA